VDVEMIPMSLDVVSLADTHETKQQEIQNVCRRNGIICVTGSCLEIIIIIIIIIIV